MFVVIVCITYFAVWCYLALHGHIDLSPLLSFLNALIGPSFVAAIAFIAGAFIDTSNDGNPDNVEGDNDRPPMNRR